MAVALLGCCFESADYVEILNTKDPEVEDHDKEDAIDTSMPVLQGASRPPRDIAKIIGAVAVVLMSMALTALGSQQLWNLLRRQSEAWCEQAPEFMSLGLHALHLGKVIHSTYCNELRDSPGVEGSIAFIPAVILGPLVLRLTYGRAYFTSWTEAEELVELERLYKERGHGTRLVLHSWRFRMAALFVFEIVIWMWLRYYLDLYLDVQAMNIFLKTKDYQFFTCNLMGIVLGLFWTAVEFYKMLREGANSASSLPGEQVLLVGLSLPLAGMHMTYLSVLSLLTGTKHRFLYISALAEAILESAVSAFVQTYAVVYSSTLEMADKIDLYSSIALSFVSIGFAFSSLDKMDGGELLCHLPGSCRSSNSRWWAVFLFRVSETASRATSLALFQRVWRPYGLFAMVAFDAVAIAVVAVFYQYARGRDSGRHPMELLRSNLIYALPSTICLMTPMLERDTPLTVPPSFYYILRVFELCAMVWLMGRRHTWDMDILHAFFEDDALVIATFAISTLLMVILGLYLRIFLAVRVLLEAPMEVWCQRPFDITQQVLRNKILLAGGRSGRLTLLSSIEQKRLLAKVEVSSNHTSGEVRARLREEGADCARGTTAEWEAVYLDAKVSTYVERSLKCLEKSLAEHSGVEATNSFHMSNQCLPPTNLQFAQSNAASGQRCELKMGSLVSLVGSEMGRGSCLTSVEGQVLMQYPHEAADQKFVVEPAFEVPYGAKVLSGDYVRLRALSSGYFLSVDQDGSIEVQAPSRGNEGAALDFTVMISHEEEFRNCVAFSRRVELAEDGLLVKELRLASAGSAGPATALDWSPCGWRIVGINGELATREMVAEIFRQAQEVDDDVRSMESKCRSPAKPSQTSSGFSITGSSKLKVRFEKVYGQDMAVAFGDKIVLRSVNSNSTHGMPVSFARACRDITEAERFETVTPRVSTGLATDQQLVAMSGGFPVIFSVEDAEIGSGDDAGIYRWAAAEIHERVDAIMIRASLPEKLKSAVVMAYNARTDLKGVGVLFQNRVLHLRLLRLLACMLREHREIEVEFGGRDALMEELRLNGGGTQSIVVEALDADDGLAAAAGIQVGDELVELEVDRDGSSNQLLCSTREISEALRLSADAEGDRRSHLADHYGLALLFRTHTQTPVDTGVQEVVVSEAPTIAQLLPGWEEIAEFHCSQRTPRQFWLPEAVEPFRHNELFRLKCLVVTSLLKQGWELNHAGFADAALAIHNNFDVLTRRQLQDIFPGSDHPRRQLRDRILIAQLDVLTAAWEMCPKTVKEHRPDVLRKLFRWHRELQAMLDAVEMIHKNWADLAQEDDAIVGMPAELLHFVERMRPMHEIGAQGSVAWIMKAWYGPQFKEEHAEVQQILSKFKSIYDSIEEYWVSKLSGAASRMEETQDQLEHALDSADVRVVLVPQKQAMTELARIQQALKADKLVLKENLSVGDSDVVPKGHRLLRRGHLDRFQASVSNKDIHERLLELASCEVDSVRLMFSGDDYHGSRERASRAIEELRTIINVVSGVAKAFPDTVALQYRELEAKQHRGELKYVTQENRRVIQVREKEFAAMMSTANLRLDHAMSERAKAHERLREAEEERAMAEEAKNEAQRKSREVMDVYDHVLKARNQLEKDKKTVEDENTALQSEKSQWIEARARMDSQLQDLQESIAKAKAERLELEVAAEKWQAILVAVKAQAEEKEAHLKEIQVILEGARKAHSKILDDNCDAQNSSASFHSPPPATTERQGTLTSEADSDVFSQVWAVISRAFNPDLPAPTSRSHSSSRPPMSRQRSQLSSISRPPMSRHSTKQLGGA